MTCRAARHPRPAASATVLVRCSSPRAVSGKPERRQARETVAAYHASMLSELVAHVSEAIDRFRDGELNEFEVDHVLARNAAR
jgi:hypothetical protein